MTRPRRIRTPLSASRRRLRRLGRWLTLLRFICICIRSFTTIMLRKARKEQERQLRH